MYDDINTKQTKPAASDIFSNSENSLIEYRIGWKSKEKAVVNAKKIVSLQPGGKVVQTAPPDRKGTPLSRGALCAYWLPGYRFNCSIWEAVALTVFEAYRLSELEEVLGELHSIEITEIGLVAVIGEIKVLLPEELAGRLKVLIGRRVGVLKLNGYHLRRQEGEKHDR